MAEVKDSKGRIIQRGDIVHGTSRAGKCDHKVLHIDQDVVKAVAIRKRESAKGSHIVDLEPGKVEIVEKKDGKKPDAGGAVHQLKPVAPKVVAPVAPPVVEPPKDLEPVEPPVADGAKDGEDDAL